ncbi:MAG: hypothetical protein U0903_19880 [Planctomycetales bacterium]
MKLSRADADRYLTEIPRADRLDLLFVSYLERAGADQDYISNTLTTADLQKYQSASGVLFGNGEEHRHNFGSGGTGYGHVMLLDIPRLIQPVSIGPGIMKTGTDGIPLQRGIDTARKDNAKILWCHNAWGREALPNVISRRIDAFNIFDGSINSTYDDQFYRFLDTGFPVIFSTGTDWFLYDFSPRLRARPGSLSVKSWLDRLTTGATFITNEFPGIHRRQSTHWQHAETHQARRSPCPRPHPKPRRFQNSGTRPQRHRHPYSEFSSCRRSL